CRLVNLDCLLKRGDVNPTKPMFACAGALRTDDAQFYASRNHGGVLAVERIFGCDGSRFLWIPDHELDSLAIGTQKTQPKVFLLFKTLFLDRKDVARNVEIIARPNDVDGAQSFALHPVEKDVC